MAEFWEEIKTKLKDIGVAWASYVTLGSFFMYVLGYLSIRFHLTTLGIGTDLAVLDERYIFAGAKFLVYLFSTVPIVILVALILVAIFGPIYKIYKRFTKNKQGRTPDRISKIAGWFQNPTRITLIGIVVSVLLIQIVMRKCFVFSNLLLEPTLPSPGLGLEELLLDETDERRSLFFVGLVAGTLLTVSLFIYARQQIREGLLAKVLLRVLAFLVMVQFLFLPINYGVLIMDKSIPEVADLGDQVPLKPGQHAWLVWEGTHGVTYLQQDTMSKEGASSVETDRRLITLPQKDLKRIEIIRYDQIFRHVFRRQ